MWKVYSFILCISLINLGVHAQKPKKAIFIIVDGIAADVIESQPTPHLDAIALIGGYTRATMGGEKDGYSQTPTISAVGYNSLLTGTWVNKHNVWGNDIKAPNYNYPTIFKLFKDHCPTKKTAVFSTWQDNRTKLVGEGLAATRNLKLDIYFDGLELDTIQYPHDAMSQYIHLIDEAVVNRASESIRDEAPDLSWVYLQYTDDMGHRFGDHENYHKAISLMDNQIGRIWDAIQYRKKTFGEEWIIFITTDHGRDAQTGKGHGGQSDRERSIWIVTNAQDLNEYFTKETPSIVDITPSLLRYLDIPVPINQLRELDGVPMIGKISAIGPSAKIQSDQIQLKWKVLDTSGMMNIWISYTNNMQKGVPDEYTKIATVPVKNGSISIPFDSTKSFYKIVFEAPYNSLNRWVMNPMK